MQSRFLPRGISLGIPSHTPPEWICCPGGPESVAAPLLVSVYIPPQAHVSSALQKLADQIIETEQQHPDSVLIILGDFNKAILSRELPKYRQHVTCPTIDSNILDHCYTAIKYAYHSVPRAALGLSDHFWPTGPHLYTDLQQISGAVWSSLLLQTLHHHSRPQKSPKSLDLMTTDLSHSSLWSWSHLRDWSWPTWRTLLDPCWILFSLPTEQTGLWMMLSIWDCITSCNTSTNLGITQWSYLWTSALPSIPSCLTFSQTNWHRSLCPPPSVSGSPASWQTGSS